MLVGATLLIIGIILLLIAYLYSIKLNKLVPEEFRSSSVWSNLLILFFILAYVAYFIGEITQLFNFKLDMDSTMNLLNWILFFGSIFVAVIILEKVHIVTKLNKSLKKSEEQNTELNQEKLDLEKTHKELDEKNKLLHEKMDDFYCLRVGMVDKTENKKIKAENKRLKKTIDKLK